MFTAAVMICLSNQPVSYQNCIVLQGPDVYKTETECVEDIANLLNNELFQYAYTNYEFKKYICHQWIDIET